MVKIIIIKFKKEKSGLTFTDENEFLTETEAKGYISENLTPKGYEEIWVEEFLHEEDTGKFNLSEIVNKWIWLYSPKQKEKFPYGVVKAISDTFVIIKTREIQEEDDFAVFRIERIKDFANTDRADFRTDGYFVSSLKEFI